MGGREREAVGTLETHMLGWQMVLTVDGESQRSKVCQTEDEVFDAIEAWRSALQAKERAPLPLPVEPGE